MESWVVQSKESFCYTGNSKSNKRQSRSFHKKEKQEHPVNQSEVRQQSKSIRDVMVFEE